ncbi:MAG: hypothetical protein ACRDYU_04040 [Actinomycetes bacterium]
MKVIPVTPQMRADALWRDYARRPRIFRLTPGHLRYIERQDAARAHQAARNGRGPGQRDGR